MADQYIDILFNGLQPTAADKPLASILGNAWGNKGNVHFRSGKLDLRDLNHFPQIGAEESITFSQEAELVKELIQLDDSTGKYTLFHHAQAWSSRKQGAGFQDASTFDVNRLAAAQFVCDRKEAEGKYLYFKGGITGIQSYIYHQVKAEQIGEAESVGRRLRGRSFFVALLGDVIAEYIVEQIGLEQANILFVGGGHFNLLLPDTEEIRDKVDGLIWRINESLLDTYHLQLGVVTAAVPVQQSDFDSFGSVFKELNDQLERNKQRRFQESEEGQIVLANVFVKSQAPQEDEQQLIREEPERIGRYVPRTLFLLEMSDLVEARSLKEYQEDEKWFRLPATGSQFYLITYQGNKKPNDPWQMVAKQLKALVDQLRATDQLKHTYLKLHRLNNSDYLPTGEAAKLLKGIPIAFGFRTLGQFAPFEDLIDSRSERLMEFSDLATIDDQGQPELPYVRLSAMRMDVDDLGALFALGLSKNESLPRILALSREMQLFFGAYFNRIAERHHIYIVYSGGDDAFVIGSWLNILRFTQKVRGDFASLAGGNPHLNFSAGIFTCNPRYPVARIADDAGKEEGKAKSFTRPNDPKRYKSKNAVRLFEHTLSWERLSEMMDFGERLLKAVGGEGSTIRRSVLLHLLRTLQSAHAAKEAIARAHELAGEEVASSEEDEAHFHFYRQLGRLHGLLTRRGYLDNSLIEQMLKDMQDFDRFQDYLVPIQYVLYQTR